MEVEAALAFAMADDTARAESLAQDLGKRFPVGTQCSRSGCQQLGRSWRWTERIRLSALNALQAASPIELGNIPFVLNISCLYPTYVRGAAYLADGQGSAAAAESEIFDRDGPLELLRERWRIWVSLVPTRRSGKPRKERRRTQPASGRSPHTEILTLWKDADPNIAVLKQAKVE